MKVTMRASSRNRALRWKMTLLLPLIGVSGLKARRVRRALKAPSQSKSIIPDLRLRFSRTDFFFRTSTVRRSEGDATMSMAEGEDYTGPPVSDDEQEEGESQPAAETQAEEMEEDEEEEAAVLDLMEEKDLDEEGNVVPSVASSKKSSKKGKGKAPTTPKRKRGNEDSDDEGEDKMTVDSTPLKPKKKKKPRKSEQINLHAVSEEQVLVANMEGTQIVHLKLRKRYYAEALDFIRWLDNASESVGELLGSTHRAEVLEAMEFFRVGFEYGIESAAVRILQVLEIEQWPDALRIHLQLGLKKMLHLIWSKDNNASTSEDGKELKGVRAKLLECYRSIYFDPVPDLEPRQQINRITKNVIECVQFMILYE